MGLLQLNRLMSMQRERRRRQIQDRERRRRQIQDRHGSIAIVAKRKGSLCQHDDNSQGGKRIRYSWPNLPEDIWCYIHSLMQLRDAARAACVSRAFLRSWRCRPNLIFTEETLGLKRNACGKGDIGRSFTSKVDHILKNHLGVGVKTLELETHDYYNLKTCYLNSWLQLAITPGIEEVILLLPSNYKGGYRFPCSLLFDGRGNSIRYLDLRCCAFRPTVGFDCLRSLTKLHLRLVHITGDELGCLLSNSFALEQLELSHCTEITCLKIPCLLERLSCLSVFACHRLHVIESKAPNLSTFNLLGHLVQLSLGEPSQVKELHMDSSENFICYAITKFPSMVPYVETLIISSISESVNTPMVAGKFLHLKYLNICLYGEEAFSPAYDYLSLVSFLDASPLLETFILGVQQECVEHASVFGDASHMRQMPEHKHASLKNVKIIGFCSAKSMVELTCHILENATSLESLIVDTIFDEDDDLNIGRCSVRKTDACTPIPRDMILEANKALLAIKRYIVGKVPSTVKLDVREPCSRCHVIEL